MGKPAARMGDMTAHGGSIVAGAPTVLIGGQPAARVGDMHVCPMLNPGVPPPPHVGAPIMPPGCPTVLICGQPAACVGDMATCSGPPDSILPPGCPTVLIGSGGGGGSGGAGAGSGAGGGTAEAPSSTSEAGEREEGEAEEGPFIDVRFTDQGGFPVVGLEYLHKTPDGETSSGVLTGRIKQQNVASGSHEITLRGITNVYWSEREAAVGDTVKMTVETTGVDDGTEVTFEVYVKDLHASSRNLATKTASVSGDKAEAEWQLDLDDDFCRRQQHKVENTVYSSPLFYFVVTMGMLTQRSGLLKLTDTLEIKLRDAEGNAIANKKYRVYLSNGEIREGQLDGDGYARVENVPPGSYRVSFDVKGSE